MQSRDCVNSKTFMYALTSTSAQQQSTVITGDVATCMGSVHCKHDCTYHIAGNFRGCKFS